MRKISKSPRHYFFFLFLFWFSLQTKQICYYLHDNICPFFFSFVFIYLFFFLHQDCISHTITYHQVIHLRNLSKLTTSPHPISIDVIIVDATMNLVMRWLREAREKRENRSPKSATNDGETLPTRRRPNPVHDWQLRRVVCASKHALIGNPRALFQVLPQNCHPTQHDLNYNRLLLLI